MTDEELIEQVARDIADALGDNFDYAFSGKAEWIAQRGETPAGFRDVNQPYKPDYIDAAISAMAAMHPRFKAERIRGGEMVKEAALAKLDEDGSEIEAALTSEGIYVWGPDGERFERMFDVVMIGRRALSVPAIVEAGDGDL